MGRGSKHGIDREEWRLRAREFMPRGEACKAAKVTAAQVKDIRRTMGQITSKEWAQRLHVSKRCIDRIRAYETWFHVR